MKIETIVTAIVFLSVGFLAGFVYKSHKDAARIQVQTAAVSSPAASSEAAPMAGNLNVNSATGLPAGHPPLEVAQIIKSYEDRAAQNPRDPQIPLSLANYLYDKQFYKLAIEWYQKSLALDPENVSARTDMGTSYFYSGDPQTAIREYHKALEINPNHEPTMFNLIVVNLEGIHNVRAAEKFWNQLHQRNPNYPGLNDLKEKLEAAAGGASAGPAQR